MLKYETGDLFMRNLYQTFINQNLNSSRVNRPIEIAFASHGVLGEEAIYYGRRNQEKGRERRQINSQVPQKSIGFRNYPGGPGPDALQI